MSRAIRPIANLQKSPPAMSSAAISVSTRAFGRAGAAPINTFAEESQTTPLTFYLYLLFVLVEFMNLGVRFSMIGIMRPTVLLVVAITAMLFFQGSFQHRKDASASTRLMITLLVYVMLTLPFVEWPGSVLRTNLAEFIKVAVYFFFTIQIIDTLPRLKIFLFVVIGVQVVRVLEPLWLHFINGYWGSGAYGAGSFMNRLSGAPADVINPNGLGFLIITVLPFLHYLLLGSPRRALKLAFFALLVPLLYALILTGSRSALVGLVVILGMLFLKTKRKALYSLVVLFGILIAIPNLSEDQADRFRSLVSNNSSHVETRTRRLDSIIEEFKIGFDRPFFGHGLGTGGEAKYNVAGGTNVPHDLYAEAFIELGLFGLALYLALIYSFIRNSIDARRSVTKLAQSNEELDGPFFVRLSDAVEVWVVMCVVFSLAQYGVSEFHWYLVGGISVAMLRLANRRVRSAFVSA